MEQKPYNCVTPPNVCCTSVTKTKQYMNLLYMESNRLSILENDCNSALDQFYYLRKEIDCYIFDALHLKRFENLEENETDNTIELINEFSNFAVTLWKEGSSKLAKNGHLIQYASLIEKPITIVISVIIQHVQESNILMNQMPCHPYCIAGLYTMCTEITNELIPRLSTADACLRQYVYLMKSIPFLTQLKEIIELYILRPHSYSVQSIYNELVLNIPPNSELPSLEDSEDMKPFRYVIDFLSGKLLGLHPLDQRSEIKPVVTDQKFKMKEYVTGMVNWILQKNKLVNRDEQNYFKRIENISRFSQHHAQNDMNINSTCNLVNSDATGYYEILQSSQLVHPSFENEMCLSCESFSEGQLYDMSDNDCTTVPVTRTVKRGRKAGSTKQSSPLLSSDLQPIKIPKLKFDLFIKPLA